MQALKYRISKDGRNLGDGILKVDGFVNHQVDPQLMYACGEAFAQRFHNVGATKVLTAEISGIAPAVMTALHMGLPVVYARKHKPITMPDQVLLTLAPSHTKGRMVELIVSPEYLAGGENVLIIDDLIAHGEVIDAWIGLWVQDLDSSLTNYYNIPKKQGVLISGVDPESPAQEAGLREGDVILAIDGRKVVSIQDYQARLRNYGVKDRLAISIWAQGKKRDISLEASAFPITKAPQLAYTLLGLKINPQSSICRR